MTMREDGEARLPNGEAEEVEAPPPSATEEPESEPEALPAEEPSLEVALAAKDEELSLLRREVEELRQQGLRLMADMENMRRRFREREERQRGEITAEVLRAILPAVDNLERAVKAAEGDEGPLAQGVRLSLRTMEEALGRLGASRFDAVGEAFDPTRHEALMEEERTDVAAGTVVEVFVAGWRLHDDVIRPALVKVARGGTPATPDGQPPAGQPEEG
jgi:molecular chaperone GrpE